MLVHFAEEHANVIDTVNAAGNYGELYPVRELALRFGLNHQDVTLVGAGDRRAREYETGKHKKAGYEYESTQIFLYCQVYVSAMPMSILRICLALFLHLVKLLVYSFCGCLDGVFQYP